MTLSINDLPFEVFLNLTLQKFIREESEEVRPSLMAVVRGLDKPRFRDIAVALLNDSEDSDPFESTPGFAEDVYWSSIEFRNRDSYHVAMVTMITPWITVHHWFRCEDPDRTTAECLLDDLTPILAEPPERAVAMGGDLKVEIHTLPVVPVEKLVKKVEQSGNTRMRNQLSARHHVKMVEVYIERHDTEEASFHGELAYRYDARPELMNNLGYLCLASDDLQRARELLEKAVEDFEESEDSPLRASALPNYNLGVVEAKEGNLEDALAKFKLAIEQMEDVGKKERRCSCLVLPKIAEEGERLRFEEVIDPDLLETAQSAASAVEELLRKR